MAIQVKHAVKVTICNVTFTGVVSGFPSRKVEYPGRPVIVKLGPGEYVTVDLAAVTPRTCDYQIAYGLPWTETCDAPAVGQWHTQDDEWFCEVHVGKPDADGTYPHPKEKTRNESDG